MTKRKKKLASELGTFLRQYGRASDTGSDPNDRRYDHRVEQKVKRLPPEDFDRLAHGDDLQDAQHRAELSLAIFLRRNRRHRFRSLLGSPAGRRKLRLQLAHFTDIDPAACEPIPSAQQSPAAIEQLLVAAGAGALCFLVAESELLDARALPLREALTAVVGQGSGALLSCVSGKLGFYEGEDASTRYILRRNAT